MTLLFKLQEWANVPFDTVNLFERIRIEGFPVYPSRLWSMIAYVYDHTRDRYTLDDILYRSELYFNL